MARTSPSRRDKKKQREYAKRYREGHKPERRERRLKLEYGLSVEDYETLNREQGGTCAICGGVDKTRRLAVDHCHETGLVRGLLCRNCNVGIGNLRDDSKLCRAAAEYLERG